MPVALVLQVMVRQVLTEIPQFLGLALLWAVGAVAVRELASLVPPVVAVVLTPQLAQVAQVPPILDTTVGMVTLMTVAVEVEVPVRLAPILQVTMLVVTVETV